MCKSQVHVRKDIVKAYRNAVPISRLQGLFSRHSTTGRWVDSPQAKIVVFLLILLNTGLVALEAYMQEDASIENNIWIYFSVQLVFSIVFAAELGLRLHGSWETLFCDPWCQYDMLMVIVSLTDSCVLNFVPVAHSAHRIFVRLMPALQVLRLGRLVQERAIVPHLARAGPVPEAPAPLPPPAPTLREALSSPPAPDGPAQEPRSVATPAPPRVQEQTAAAQVFYGPPVQLAQFRATAHAVPAAVGCPPHTGAAARAPDPHASWCGELTPLLPVRFVVPGWQDTAPASSGRSSSASPRWSSLPQSSRRWASASPARSRPRGEARAGEAVPAEGLETQEAWAMPALFLDEATQRLLSVHGVPAAEGDSGAGRPSAAGPPAGGRHRRFGWPEASERSVAAAPETSAFGSDRVAHVKWLIQQFGWSGVAFDKLVLHLDRMGIELSIPEQDRLRRVLH